MPGAQLYFLTDQYYQDFQDDKLMKNKGRIDGVLHNRPCFFAFQDSKNPKIFWIVPISSKYEKYKKIEQEKIKRYGHCSTIRFGTVLGRNAAFLIQNMCPATENYLTEYLDKNNSPIRIDNRVAADVITYAREVLGMARRGAKVIFPDVKKDFRFSCRIIISEESLLCCKRADGSCYDDQRKCGTVGEGLLKSVRVSQRGFQRADQT